MDFQPMSPEEMQRTMQFLLNQQAQFAADFAQNEALMKQGFSRVNDGLARVNDGLVGLTAIVGQLAAAQLRSDQRMDALGQRVDDVGAYIKTVEAHLNVVIEMFERHPREDHGQQAN